MREPSKYGDSSPQPKQKVRVLDSEGNECEAGDTLVGYSTRREYEVLAIGSTKVFMRDDSGVESTSLIESVKLYYTLKKPVKKLYAYAGGRIWQLIFMPVDREVLENGNGGPYSRAPEFDIEYK